MVNEDADMRKNIRIHILHCGYMQVSPTVPFGDSISLKNSARQIFARERVTLPVSAYLIEHPNGLILVDTGWCRDISPKGVYDPKAVRSVLPKHLAALYQPYVPEGMAIHEQLEARGIRPEDLDIVLLTHLDPDHVAGLRHVKGAKRILVPEDEYFWNCRLVYQARQPKKLFEGIEMERFFYRGSSLGTNRWAYDLMGDETILCINIPGHTDGMCALLVQNGELLEHKRRFAILASDAAYCPRNWEEGITPGLGFHRELQKRGLDWLKEQAAHPGCIAILANHDPDMQPQTITIANPT